MKWLQIVGCGLLITGAKYSEFRVFLMTAGVAILLYVHKDSK